MSSESGEEKMSDERRSEERHSDSGVSPELLATALAMALRQLGIQSQTNQKASSTSSEEIQPVVSSKQSIPYFDGDLSMLNSISFQGFWKQDKTTQMSVAPLLSDVSFNLAADFSSFDSHFKLLARNLKVLPMLEGTESNPITVYEVASAIGEQNILLSDVVDYQVSSNGDRLLYYDTGGSDITTVAASSVSAIARTGAIFSTRRRVVSPEDASEFGAAKNVLYTYLYKLIGKNKELISIANSLDNSYHDGDPFGAFRALEKNFVRVSGISIVSCVMNLLQIRQDDTIKSIPQVIARMEECKTELERRNVDIPTIVYQAMFMLAIKDNQLRQKLNYEISSHAQRQEEFGWVDAIEIARSYSIDESDFKSLAKKEGKKSEKDGRSFGSNKPKPEGTEALVHTQQVSQVKFSHGNCMKCMSESGTTSPWPCDKHPSKKKKTSSNAHVVVVGQSLEEINSICESLYEDSTLPYDDALNHAIVAAVDDSSLSDLVVADSACTTSVQPDSSYLSDVRPIVRNAPIITVGNGAQERVSFTGQYMHVDTHVAPNIQYRLLSIPQLDAKLGAATIVIDGYMVSFVPTSEQRRVLANLLDDSSEQHLYCARRMKDGLYKFPASDPCAFSPTYKSTTAVSLASNTEPPRSTALVNVFPRMTTSTLSEAVYFYHLLLGHMPVAAMIFAAKYKLYRGLPEWFTPDHIRKHWKPCRACYLAHMRVLPVVVPKNARQQRVLELSPDDLNKEHLSIPHSPDLYKASRCAEIISIDSWGPYPFSTYSGFVYVNFAICVYSEYIIVSLSKSSGKHELFVQHVIEESARDGHVVGNIRVDPAFVTQKISSLTATAYLPNAGIKIQQSATAEHFQNPHAERGLQTMARRTTANFLSFDDIPKEAWGYCALDTVFKLRFKPSRRHDHQSTPFELWTGQKPDLNLTLLLPFFMPVYAHIPDSRISDKLSPHAFVGYYVGTVPGSKRCIQVLNPQTKRTSIRRSIMPAIEQSIDHFLVEDADADGSMDQFIEDAEFFIEPSIPCDPLATPLSHGEGVAGEPQIFDAPISNYDAKMSFESPDSASIDPPLSVPEGAPPKSATALDVSPGATGPGPPDGTGPGPPRVSIRLAEKAASKAAKLSRDTTPVQANAKRYHQVLLVYEKLNLQLTTRAKRSRKAKNSSRLRLRKGLITALLSKTQDPVSLAQAQKSDYAEEWEAAREAEYSSLWNRGSFQDVSVDKVHQLRRDGVKILKSKYVFKTARHADGSLKKFKVRLCVRGDLQDPSTYGDTFAGTVQRKAVFLLLAIANHKDLEVSTADITSAFLYPDLEEELYLELPDGRVVRLLKALYGLKQAANAFLIFLKEKLTAIGFTQMMSDTCTFRLEEGDAFLILATHVDDLLFISNSKKLISKVKDLLATSFDLTFYEKATEYLGLTISRDRANKILKLSQVGYVEKILSTFTFPHSRVTRTPHVYGSPGEEQTGALAQGDKQLFMQITGSLLYLAISTRPDILSCVHNLTRHMQNPSKFDLDSAHRALRYLLLTPDLCLTFNGNSSLEVIGSADSSFTKNERNQFGYCFQLGANSGTFVNVVKRSTKTALSSTEAEYYALCEGCRELLWIHNFTREIGFSDIPVRVMKQDNKSCISYASTLGVSDRMKHVDLEYTFVKNLTHEGRVVLLYEKTKSMLADIFTKALPVSQFEYLRDRILGTYELDDTQ